MILYMPFVSKTVPIFVSSRTHIRSYVGPPVWQDVSSDDEDGKDNDDVEIVAGRRPLKRRRSNRHTKDEVGTSLSFWIGQQFKEMFGQSLMCKYKVGTRSTVCMYLAWCTVCMYLLSHMYVCMYVCKAPPGAWLQGVYVPRHISMVCTSCSCCSCSCCSSCACCSCCSCDPNT